MSARPLSALFSPASVAVLGASNDGTKWGHWLARGALEGESRRTVYLVNRRGGEVLGRRTYTSLAALPGTPELVVVVVPFAGLEQAVDEALARGARAIVAISAGETGTARSDRLDGDLAQRVRAAGAVMLGPNCLGVLDAAEQLHLTSNPLPPGPIGLISQSGNLALELAMLAEAQGLGFSRFVSLGNQADLDATDLIRDLTAHAQTKLIALYVEDFRDGRAFARAAAAAVGSGKPVVALAIEHGEASARAARSHTGALASDGAAIDAACAAAGIERVATPAEMVDVAQALLRAPRARGRRVGVLADGGGHGAIGATLATAAGLELPELADRTADALRGLMPPSAAVGNPVDLAGGGERDVATFERASRVLLESGELDGMLLTGYFGGYALYTPEMGESEIRTARRLGAVVAATGRPLVCHTMYPSSPVAYALRDAGIPTYARVEQAVGALRRLAADHGAGLTAIPGIPPAAEPLRGEGYQAARALLSAAGVPLTAQRTATNASEALAAACEIGYPVVLKALGSDHKSDRGGVVLGLGDDTSLRDAYAELERRLAPEACSVEQMAPLGKGVELVIGCRWDARFGPIALAGSGGIYTEILRDISVALAPVSVADAEAMLRSLRAAPLLTGARGRPALDLTAAARALADLSLAASSHPELSELEVNPLLVTPDGAIGLDARCVRATTTTQEHNHRAVHIHTAAA
jgi:acyl-CoA synthetase (NDP forming)